jgi:hypothetical protein
MPEWWTYSLSDFLLFSPRTYYRLIGRHNLDVWPAHLLALALGGAIATLVLRRSPARSRAVAGILAAAWAWVGWSFVAGRYATINWAAAYLAWLFAAEALLLAGIGVVTRDGRFELRRDRSGRAGTALFAGAVALYPLLAPTFGRGWTQAEVFGVMPDPTALATMGLLLNLEGSARLRWALLVPPLAWCLVSGLTLLALAAPERWVVLPALVLAFALSLAPRRSAH